MSLEIIYGRSGTGKTSYIFDEISKSINNGKKKYIITPEQFSFTAEKELLRNIKLNTNSTAVINAEVLTFNRMSHRVKSEVGGLTKVALSNSGKSMLIYNILADKKSELKFLGKSDNNIDLVLRQITELKQHGVNINNLQELMDNVKENKYLYSKLNDIYSVYNKYEEMIKGKFIDDNDSLSVLAEQIERTNIFDDTEIYIDEFVGFTKQEYIIIEKLMKVANKVVVTVCSDDLNPNKNADTDIFYSNKHTVENLIKIAKDNDIENEERICLKNKLRFKSEELIHLEENIYNTPYNTYEKNCENIKIFLSNNQYSEVENVAKNIVKLVRDENYKYNEISVITQNIDTYSNLCRVIFNKYNIPVYIDEKGDLSQNILVKYILAILEIFSRNWTCESIMNYLKTGFTNLTTDEIYMLEKYAIKWNVKGSKWYKEDWNFHDENKVGLDKIKRINELRKIAVNPLTEFKSNITGTKTAKQISENIYNFLIDNEIDIKLEEKIEKLRNNAELNIASEYETSWKIIMQVLDEIVMVFGDENITFERYMQMLKAGFANSDLGTIPMSQDQVTVGDVDRSRSHKVKAVFIIGLNDGSFPSINKAEGFLNDEDRDLVKKYGIELAKGTLERIYEDNFNIYKAFTTAEQKLYLSYSSADSEGKSLRPAVIISKVKKMFKNIKETSDIIKHIPEITNKQSTFEELLTQIRKIDSLWGRRKKCN